VDFLCVDGRSRRLFATEVDTAEHGVHRAFVSAWIMDADTGRLTLANRSPGSRARAAHVVLAAGGSRLVLSNYPDGSFDLFCVAGDGSVGRLLDTVRQSGAGPHPRQATPHPHMAVADPSDRWLLTVDLGLDALDVHDASGARLALRQRVVGPRGDGLRHAVFHPRMPLLYVVGEMALQRSRLRLRPGRGTDRQSNRDAEYAAAAARLAGDHQRHRSFAGARQAGRRQPGRHRGAPAV
jgi:6-phosphogluconolactonase (cycloisomerase 2 family)